MGAVVIADYQLGGKTGLSRDDLNKVIKVLGIKDPQGKLPVGAKATYLLVLETEAQVPSTIKKLKKKKKAK